MASCWVVMRASTAVEREAYADGLAEARTLIAVSAASNRSTADEDPATWLPPAAVHRCQYATDWIADKTRWGLTIDTTEHDALAERPGRCPDPPVAVPLAGAAGSV